VNSADDIDQLLAQAMPQPATEVMQRAFHERCRWVELTLRIRAEAEISMRGHNFSSGRPIEAILREELARILPNRYQVTCGTLSDQNGLTAGDVDAVVFNDTWFPAVKPAATMDDRERVMPIEGAYAVFEVKQTLGLQQLDDALQKLVTCHRLFRPIATASQITENRQIPSKGITVSNPLFSAVVAVRRDPDCELEELVSRFINVNRRLHPRRDHMVQCLCILGEACYFWGWVPDGTNVQIAKFMGPDDLQEPLGLIEAHPAAGESPFGGFVAKLYGQLTNCVLSDPTDLPVAYGINQQLRPFASGFPLIPAVPPQPEANS
jgi:hypothetical protein